MTNREEFIQALRDCANFLETHSNVTAPRYVNMTAFVDEKDEMMQNARAAAWQKVYGTGWFSLRKSFTDRLTLDITIEREKVCRQVVTGVRTVPAQPATPEREEDVTEWICDEPLLAGGN